MQPLQLNLSRSWIQKRYGTTLLNCRNRVYIKSQCVQEAFEFLNAPTIPKESVRDVFYQNDQGKSGRSGRDGESTKSVIETTETQGNRVSPRRRKVQAPNDYAERTIAGSRTVQIPIGMKPRRFPRGRRTAARRR